MKYDNLKTLLTFTIFCFSINVLAQTPTLYLPAGPTDIGNSNTANVGIGTNSYPAEKLHVAGNIQIGSADASTPGTYYVNMPSGQGTVNGGYGRDLVIQAGSSDNQSNVKGGNLFLRPGIPVAPTTTYGNVIIGESGGTWEWAL